ncbi:MAG: cytochrome-c peroxidase [Sphingobacterium sp.]|jgi:cytochrome c peroxidase|nr:cytochrome-c peroxidase [Sphingobacterium sp.]
MKKIKVLLPLFIAIVLLSSFFASSEDEPPDFTWLRSLYERPLNEWPKADVDAQVDYVEWAPLPAPPIWSDKDPQTQAKLQLGKRLFFDPRLSASKQISCSSCHDPDMHWADGRKRAIGESHRQGRRHSPSLQNIWSQKLLFWDGRAASLEAQAHSPIEDPNEMNTPMPVALAQINQIAGYRSYIRAAFGAEQLHAAQLEEALALFERSISSNITRFDNFLKGRYRALSDQQVWGLHLFRTKARCFNCHNGPFFQDGKFHNLGFSNYGKANADLGRYEVTGKKEDVGAFKTASLRDAARTFPWFHDGRFSDLSMLLNQYTAGMPQPKARGSMLTDSLYPAQSVLLKPLQINLAEREAIIRFLEALSTQPITVERPNLPN